MKGLFSSIRDAVVGAVRGAARVAVGAARVAVGALRMVGRGCGAILRAVWDVAKTATRTVLKISDYVPWWAQLGAGYLISYHLWTQVLPAAIKRRVIRALVGAVGAPLGAIGGAAIYGAQLVGYAGVWYYREAQALGHWLWRQYGMATITIPPPIF